MQILKFIRVARGVSKKGRDYDMTEVSDGLNSFSLSNAPGIAETLLAKNLKEGDSFEAEVHVALQFSTLRGTIVKVK